MSGKDGFFHKDQQRRSRGCKRKQRHEHFEEASAACRALRAKGEKVEVYACQFCGGWHVGH